MLHQLMYIKKMRHLIATHLFPNLNQFLNLYNSINQTLGLNSHIRFLKDTNSNILNLKVLTLNSN
jgi:hypothetical protein